MALSLFVLFATAAFADETRIRLNTVGYPPDAPKRATVAATFTTFTVIRESDGAEVMTGRATPRGENALDIADFSSLTTPGVYRLDIPGVGRSPPFRIANDVYDSPFHAAMLGMTLWRCGTAISGEWNGQRFSHDACHLNDGWLDFAGGGHVRRDGVGGWHDAGDYNKYVVNAGFTVGVLLQAWERFQPKLEKVSLDLPERSNATPDFLDEVRWELDWLLKMQEADGRVLHKLSTPKFGGFILPERETTDRFFSPWSSAATADFAAVMAMAARIYEPYDRPFSQRCSNAAKLSHHFLAEHPANHPADLKQFSTGPYQADDASRRLWMAAELWETTGDGRFLKEFESRLSAFDRKFDFTSGWGNTKNLGVHTYVLSKRAGREEALLAAVRKEVVATADAIVATAARHDYARPIGDKYFWGANGDVAQVAQTLHVADVLSPSPRYRETALDALNNLLGRNPFGRSFVTGVGDRPPLHPHDRRSGADGKPWPGYLVGGGWPKATDWVDEQKSYQTNEIAINWNATLIYTLASAMKEEPRP